MFLAFLADFYCEVLQFLDIPDIGRLSGANKGVRQLSYGNGRWHVPALYLPMLLQPHLLLKVHQRQVRFIDVKGLDVLLSRSTQKLLDLKAEMKANRGKSPKIVGIESTKEVLSVILGIDPPDPEAQEESNTFLTASHEPELYVWDNALELIDMMTRLPDITLRFGRYRFEFQQKWNQFADCWQEIQSWRTQKLQLPMQSVLTWTKIIIAIVFTKITLGPDLESPFCEALKSKRRSSNYLRGNDFSPSQLIKLNQYGTDNNARGCLTPLWACAGSVKLRQRILDEDPSFSSNAMPTNANVRDNLGTMFGMELLPNNSIPSPRHKGESIVGWSIAHPWEAGLATSGIESFQDFSPTIVVEGLINPQTLRELDLEHIERVIGLSSPLFSVELELIGPSIAELKDSIARKHSYALDPKDVRIDTPDIRTIKQSVDNASEMSISSIKSTLPADFHFSKLRALETEVLRADLNSVHVLTPFRKSRRRLMITSWNRQRCEKLIRSVWPKSNQFPPICTELLQEEERKRCHSARGDSVRLRPTSRRNREGKLRLATTLTLMDKLGIPRTCSRGTDQHRDSSLLGDPMEENPQQRHFTPNVHKFVRSGDCFSLQSGNGNDGRRFEGGMGRTATAGAPFRFPNVNGNNRGALHGAKDPMKTF